MNSILFLCMLSWPPGGGDGVLSGILVDDVNYEEWLGIRRGDKPVCRHFTFKLGVLLYAIRLPGLDLEIGPRLDHLKHRLWGAQTESGGVAHFVEVQGEREDDRE